MTDSAHHRPVQDGELESLVGELRRRVDHAMSAAAASPADGGSAPSAALMEAVTAEVRRVLDAWALQHIEPASRRADELHATLSALRQEVARIGALVERGQDRLEAVAHVPARTGSPEDMDEPEIRMSGPRNIGEHQPRSPRPWLMLASVTTGLVLAGGAVVWLENPGMHARDLLEMLVRSIT